MSIYGKESYSESKCGFLAGPIEWWWQENRFDSDEAKMYRAWRDTVSMGLVNAGHLVYRPWDAFKGSWNERFQGVNNFVLEKSDFVVEMTPPGVVALGTDHEVAIALKIETPVFWAPPPAFDRFEIEIAELIKAIDKVLNGVS